MYRTAVVRSSVVLAALTSLSVPGGSPWASEAAPKPPFTQQLKQQRSPGKWNLGVVFRRDHAGRLLVGTLSNPAVPPMGVGTGLDQRQDKSSTEVGCVVDYEVWLAGDGVTRGLWYSSTGGLWGPLASEGETEAKYRDDGTLKRLISRARPVVAQRPRPADLSASALYPDPPQSLADLASARVICVGRVVGVLRNAYTPMGFPNPMQHTVYVFAVERYLKVDAFGSRPLLKVWQEGGTLPWQRPDGAARGLGSETLEDPLLNVGDRYILFLTLPPDPGGVHRRRGYVAGEVVGIHGKVAELDEYIVAHPWRGKIMLHNGMTRAPRTTGQQNLDHWRFAEAPQILDVPEGVAIQTIRQTLARAQSR